MANMDVVEPDKRPSAARGWLSRHRRTLIVITSCCIVALAAGFGGWYYANTMRNPIPESITRTVDFPIYFPSYTPPGYSFDDTSPLYSGGILMYRFKDAKNIGIVAVSEQRVPSDFNPQQILQRPDKEPIKLAHGSAYDISTDEQGLYAIVTADHLMLSIRAVPKQTDEVTQAFLSSLSPLASH